MLGTTNGSDGDVPFHYGGYFTEDWLVIKTDSVGNVQWSRDLGTSFNDGTVGSILAIDSDYYLVSAAESYDHDCTDTAWHSGVNTGADVYILKLDGYGNLLWSRSYGGSQTDQANFAFFDTRDSAMVIVGTTSSNDYMVTGYHPSLDEGDIWVLKVNKAGNLLWQKTLGSIQEEKGTGICARREGGYIVYGSTKPYNCHDSALGDIGADDCWLFALDNYGNTITDKIFGGTSPEIAYSVIPYLNGYVAAGLSGSSVFTEGTCNITISGAFISYIDYWPLGISNTNATGDFVTVFPNPANDMVTFTYSIQDACAPIRLVVNNVIGKTVHDVYFTDSNGSSNWNTSSLPPGVYLYRVTCENGIISTGKLVIQK